jgi:CCR4-NOT transcription complex subunit 4
MPCPPTLLPCCCVLQSCAALLQYDKEKITMAQLDPDVVQKEQQRRKEQQSKKRTVADGHHRPPRALGQVRVVQRNLVYAVGMPLSICREDVLAHKDYFGQFGRIKKVSVNRSTPFSQVQKNGPSGSAYVTYFRPEDALRCIEAVDGSTWEGKTIKACFGTTKYCNAFLKGVPCNNQDCLYLHDIAEAGDSFSKEDMMANGLASGRSTFFDMVHPTSTKEAAAHAHAVLSSMGSGGSSSGGGAGPSGSSSGSACASGRPATQPMAITGVSASSTICNIQRCSPASSNPNTS